MCDDRGRIDPQVEEGFKCTEKKRIGVEEDELSSASTEAAMFL